LNGQRAFFVAAEGIPFLLAAALAIAAAWYICGLTWALLPFALFIWLYLVFRDPWREVASAPLGVVSPVDGTVAELSPDNYGDDESKEAGVQRIVIRVSSLGTYTARSPVEGKITDFGVTPEPPDGAPGLWLLTDEGENVVLRFRGNRFGIAPRASLTYGERVGQGQRCAYLRLTKFAEIELPRGSRLLVTEGQRVSAATDLLAMLPQA
jgi:phosphatidylserine decarboxylase